MHHFGTNVSNGAQPVSGITFSTYPVSSQTATQAAPRSDAAHAGSLEQSYLSASQRSMPSAPVATPQNQGPVLTTLAVGEEDGGSMGAMPGPGSMPAYGDGGGMQVTTLAIGEEDGGAVSGGYGTMSPIPDDHSVIGGHVGGDPAGGYSIPATQGVQAEGYGGMQPIYSPGEAEYPAFAKTSETTDLLNFHPVARVPKAALPQSMPVAAPVPIAITAPAMAQPMAASPMPVGALPQDVPQSGSYESVGSYEEYVGATQPAPVATMPPASQYIETTPAYEPAPAMEAPAMEAMEPVYETYQPTYESIQTPPAAPAYEPAPATYAPVAAPDPVASYEAAPVAEPMAPAMPDAVASYETVPVAEPATVAAPDPVATYEAAPVAEPAAPVVAYAPETSAEPRSKPSLFDKDTPLDYASGVEAADPADGNPDYVAPAAETAEAPVAEPAPEMAEPAEPEATYVQVSIDDYLVEADAAPATPAGDATASMEPAAPVSAPASDAATTAAPAPVAAPDAASADAVSTDAPTPEPAMSLGGSYVVMDLPPVLSTGASSGAGNAGPEASSGETAGEAVTDPAEEDLRIITLSTGEEAGSQ